MGISLLRVARSLFPLKQFAALGRVEEAMSAAKILMERAEEGFALAKILREDGYLVEALEICQAGINLRGNCLYEFATWTSDLAIRIRG